MSGHSRRAREGSPGAGLREEEDWQLGGQPGSIGECHSAWGVGTEQPPMEGAQERGRAEVRFSICLIAPKHVSSFLLLC